MSKIVGRLVISIAIGAVLLYLAMRGTPLHGVAQALTDAQWHVLWPYFFCMALQHLLRAWRWGELLAPIHPVPFSRILPISTVGFFAILALPLRMGEFVRPMLIAQPPRLRIAHAVGTIAVERILDGLILSLLAAASVFVAKASDRMVPPWILAAGMTSLTIFIVALGALVLAIWQQEHAVTLCRRLFGLISNTLATGAARMAQGVVEGCQALPDARHLIRFIAATLGYWGINALAIWVLSGGFALDLDLAAAFAVIALTGIGIMIPAGPGFVGNFELFAKGALALYIPRETLADRGSAFILTMHATNALWYTATGILALFSKHVQIKSPLRADGQDSPSPSSESTGGKLF